jgi:hypothetical protein
MIYSNETNFNTTKTNDTENWQNIIVVELVLHFADTGQHTLIRPKNPEAG